MDKKNILILSASPRENSNSNFLAEEFSAAVRKKGHDVTIVRLRDYNIAPCTACEKCWSKEGEPCVRQDDMRKLYPVLEKADAVVFATPMYYFSFPAQLKLFIDRMYPYSSEKASCGLDGKISAMIVCGAESEEDQYEAVFSTYDLLTDYLEWEDYGVLAATGLWQQGEAQGSKWAESARDLALDF